MFNDVLFRFLCSFLKSNSHFFYRTALDCIRLALFLVQNVSINITKLIYKTAIKYLFPFIALKFISASFIFVSFLAEWNLYGFFSLFSQQSLTLYLCRQYLIAWQLCKIGLLSFLWRKGLCQ